MFLLVHIFIFIFENLIIKYKFNHYLSTLHILINKDIHIKEIFFILY